MKKRIDVIAVLVFLVALAALFAAAKVGHHPHGNGYGFFSGG